MYPATYFNLFPPDQIHISFFDDLRSDSRRFLEDIETFLGVPSFVPANLDEPVNVTGVPRFPILNRAISWELVLLLVIIYVPFFHEPMTTVSLALLDWVTLVLLALTVVPILEFTKWLSKKGVFGELSG